MISIVITIYNPENLSFKNEKFLRPQLESLIKYTNLSNTEIILIVNGYTPETVFTITSCIRHHDNIFKIWYFKEPLGYTKAANEGMKRAKGDFIILLNDDVILLGQPKNYWVSRLLEPFVFDIKMGITGCHKLKCSITNEYFIVGYCMCIKREVINKIGYYDEIFSPGYGEDIDYNLRAKKAGFLIQEVGGQYKEEKEMTIGTLPLFHRGGLSFESIPNTLERKFRNEQILFDKKSKDFYESENRN